MSMLPPPRSSGKHTKAEFKKRKSSKHKLPKPNDDDIWTKNEENAIQSPKSEVQLDSSLFSMHMDNMNSQMSSHISHDTDPSNPFHLKQKLMSVEFSNVNIQPDLISNPFAEPNPFRAEGTPINSIVNNNNNKCNDNNDSDSEQSQQLKNKNKKKLSPEQAQQEIAHIDKKIEKYSEKIALLVAKKEEYLVQYNINDQHKNKKKHRAASVSIPSSMSNYEQIEALSYMKKGSAMLKYGRKGFPHFRQFELSQDNRFLIWYSSSKKMNQSRIKLSDVVYLQKGQLTPVFKKHLQPRLTSCSFSLLYDNRSRSLDVIAKNKFSYFIWVSALQKLIAFYKKCKREGNDGKAFTGDIYLNVAKKNEKNIERRLSLQPQPPMKIVRKELEMVNKRFRKLSAMSNDSKYQKCEKMNEARERLVELESEIDLITHTFHSKSLNIVSHQIWRTAVELKALDNKMQVIAKK